MPRLLGMLFLLCALAGSVLLAQEQKKEPELTKEERAKLAVEAKRLNEEGEKFYDAAKFSDAEKACRRALQMRQQLYPKEAFPDGHPDLALSLSNLAYILQAQGRLHLAESLCRDALAMRRRLYPPTRFPDGHPNLALSLDNLAYVLQAQDRRDLAEPLCRDALAMRQKLYPPAHYPNGHPDLASSLNNLANLHNVPGRQAQAEPLYRDALAMYRKLYPPARYPDGHQDLATSLHNLARLLKDQGRLAQAEPLYRDALAMEQKLYSPARYPHGHPDLAISLHNLAHLLLDQGRLAQAEPLFRDALVMRQKLYPPAHYPNGHPNLASSMDNLGHVLQVQGQLSLAEPLFRDALAMRQKLYPPTRFPDGHPNLANTLNNLASLLQAQGQLTRAEPLYREALTMRQKLYPPARFPQGHSTLAHSLNNLASMLQHQGRLTQAEPLFRDALTMHQKLYPPVRYPDGHPDLATSLNNLAYLLRAQGHLTQADPLLRDALTMYQKLYPPVRYPDGHANLAQGLNNLALQHHDQGRLVQAEPLYRDALAMRQKLYPPARFPNGHPDLANSLNNLAGLLEAEGNRTEAESLYRDALAMYRRLTVAYAEVRGDGEVLTLLATRPGTQHGYLSLLQRQPELAPRGYATLWDSRSYLSRLAEQKRMAVRAAVVSPEFRKQWVELVSLKQQRAQLLLAPEVRDPETNKEREKLLEEWGRKINDLSAQVRDSLPALRELQWLDNSTPTNLQQALSKAAVFVDLLHYTYFEYDPAKPGKAGEKRSLRYVAFLVTKDQIHHIDLGPAEPLEAAVKQWRESITGKNTAADLKAPATLRRLLWEPLEKQFPQGTTTVYLCPDQQLCFLPWAALPGKKPESVLLEEYNLAIVPHGPYLLGQLLGTKDKEEKKTDLLVLGGVKYDDAPVQAAVALGDRGPDDPKAAPVQAVKGGWPYLKGTAQEAETIRKLAGQRQLKTQFLHDREAGTERFKQELPRARIAHLATHGFFADKQFRSVFQLDEKHFTMRGQERVGAGALLPSLLSGLVFAGANRPETPGRGIVTAEELFDLDLTSMELAVLSACETGLGEVGGGEGVFGLQRAFHVAGCQNVIASLWKVNDVATMVLMEEFYRNLWEKKLSKREALRQAQLTIYRNPDLVTRRAKEMGVRGIDDEATPLPAAGAAPVRRSPAKWWAAFLLSGLGE